MTVDDNKNNQAKNHYQAALDHSVTAERKVYRQDLVYTHDNPSSETLTCSKSDTSSSISSLSSTEGFIALHHISISDPNDKDPNATVNHDTIPLIDLYHRSHNFKSANAFSYNENRTFTPSGQPFPTKSTLQRSPGFVIDRMKERHRQECRRSWQGTLIVPETKIVQPVRRAIKDRSNIAFHIQQQNFFQQQQQQQQFPLLDNRFAGESLQRVTAVPAVSISSQVLTNQYVFPFKSYSTINNSQHRETVIASKTHLRQLGIMKPIQENPQIPEPFSRLESKQPNFDTPSSKKAIGRIQVLLNAQSRMV